MSSDKEVKAHTATSIWKNVEENAHDKIELISKKFYTESDYDSLKQDLEALVKMYGARSNWREDSDQRGDTFRVYPIINASDVSQLKDVRKDVGGKLAREIGDKRGIKYE